MKYKTHAEVAGGGFAGLTVATALAQRGWSVRVHEKNPDLREFGAGIFIWENGLRVLKALGCYEQVMKTAHEAPYYESRNQKNETVSKVEFGKTLGTRMITMTRQHLYGAVLEAAMSQGVDISTSSEVVGAEKAGVLETASGAKYEASLVVGAEGVKSAVRDSLGLLESREKYYDGVIRVLVPRSKEEAATPDWNNVIDFWRLEPTARRILYVPCGPDWLYLAFMAMAKDKEAAAVPLNKEIWTESFPLLAPMIQRVGSEGRYDIYSTTNVSRWSSGSVALVGDAAHAMPPTLGQGAGCAMMNGLSLAVAVRDGRNIERSLKKWESDERPLTEHTKRVASSHAEGRRFSSGDMWSEEALKAAIHRPTGT